jgi:pimeloyl-ACP methyl ester carboxylesterase
VIAVLSGFVEVEDGRLFYETAGDDGPAVVMIHPGLWDRRAWDDQFEAFAERYRVVRYDVRGYGRSTRPDGLRYSHVRDLARLLDALGIARTALVGCSMGGGIALDAALEHPDRVLALVLAAPGLGGFEGTPEDDAWWAERQGPIEAALRTGELDRAEDLRLAIWAPLGTGDEAGSRIRRIAFDNLHELTMDEGGEEELDPPAIGRLEQIAVPTLVLPADHDPPFMIEICRILASRIANARMVQIPETDHVIGMRRPEEFNHVVLGFLGEVL